MKKTKIGQGRRLLLRGEAVAFLMQSDLPKIGGAVDPVSGGSFPQACSTHTSTIT